MNTPKKYTKNLKNEIITNDMLADCIYSSNKRAKNWRDKEKEERNKRKNNKYYYDKYDNEKKAKNKKEEYYHQKEILLSLLNPVCIHKEKLIKNRRVRIYDYLPEYEENTKNFIHKGEFFDKELREVVCFGDIIVKYTQYNYYLYYEVNNKGFHQPISEKDLGKFQLEVKEITNLNTTGGKIEDLISNQFVKKVVDLILSGNYNYINENR